MRFTLDIGEKEKHQIDYYRNCFFGTERLRVDGEIVISRSAFSVSTHVNFQLRTRYEFGIGASEPHKVVFEKVRPMLFGGLRSHVYRIFVDGKKVHEQQGY